MRSLDFLDQSVNVNLALSRLARDECFIKNLVNA